MTVAVAPGFSSRSPLRAAIGLHCALCWCASARPDEGAMVLRERAVLATGDALRDRWFASVYALQSLIATDERLRAQSLTRLCALLNLPPDADADAVASAIRSRAAREHATLTPAPAEAPPVVRAQVAVWTRSLGAGDLGPGALDALPGLEGNPAASVRCEPPGASVCGPITQELSRSFGAAIARRDLSSAIASSPAARQAFAARAEALAQVAPRSLAAEFNAAREFLRGLHARSAAMANANSLQVQWVRAIGAPEAER